MREQLWLVPGGDPAIPLRATMFRPHEPEQPMKRRPLVMINHGSDMGRIAVSMPVFYWLSRWFVERGYVVLLPQRRGHGATGGNPVEAMDSCSDPDHYEAGTAAADDIQAAVNFMREQAFIEPNQIVVAGISTGGWGALALAARNPAGVRLFVNFAGGRGGHAFGQRNAVCGPEGLIAAAGLYGARARAPTLWLYARNDSYFEPELAAAMADAWMHAGGKAELKILAPYGQDGHLIANDQAGWGLWGDVLDQALLAHVSRGALAFAR